jgi:peptidoglycan/LPS O-acetylase OafA/YrhL
MTTTRKPASATTRVARWFKSPAGEKLSHRVPALVVFGVAAYQSYWHTVDVVARAGEGDHGVAHIMALSVDGLMMVAARYITHAPSRLGKAVAFVAFILGVAATLGTNMAAADPNMFSRVVAVWPAVALIGTAAMLHWGDRKPAKKPVARRTPVVATVTTPAKLKAV